MALRRSSGYTLSTNLGGRSSPTVIPRPSAISFDNPTIDIGAGGITGSVDLGGVTVRGTIPFGGGSESPSGDPAVPSRLVDPSSPSSGSCPGILQVRDPITGSCIDLTALPPGGDPAMVGPVGGNGYGDGYGAAVKGYFGVGIQPRVEVQTVRRCPPGTALGKDGVCYEGLSRNSRKRMWPMGQKPLMTGGDRAAIARAKRVAGKLLNARKSLKKAGKALEKVGC